LNLIKVKPSFVAVTATTIVIIYLSLLSLFAIWRLKSNIVITVICLLEAEIQTLSLLLLSSSSLLCLPNFVEWRIFIWRGLVGTQEGMKEHAAMPKIAFNVCGGAQFLFKFYFSMCQILGVNFCPVFCIVLVGGCWNLGCEMEFKHNASTFCI